MDDPRPLPGEPLALDLVNTRWITAEGPRDLLAETGGLEVWLRAAGHPRAPRDTAAATALLSTRDAIRAAVADPADAAALNAVLAHGALTERLGPGGPERTLAVDAERWRA